MNAKHISALALCVALTGFSPVRMGAQTCPGDCNDDRRVTVNELVLGVNIALEAADVSACPAIDANHSLRVTIDELVSAVGNALHECPPTTPSPTPTATPMVPTLPVPTPTDTVTTGNAPPNALDDAVATLVADSIPIVVLANDSDPNADPLTVTSFSQPAHGTVGFSDNVATYMPNGGFSGTDSFTYTLSDGNGGTASATVTVAVNSTPPDPATTASPPTNGVATILADATGFLYTGADATQFGVAPDTIERVRVAVVRGQVETRDGTPLAGVRISVLGHPEFGFTATRADGMFDMAVNGGGIVTINYDKTGFCPVQRTVNVPWQEYVMAPDVMMTPLDPIVTPIGLGVTSEMQMAQGSMQTDSEGTRRATLLFPPGTAANLVMPDGSRHGVSSLSVRATEFTVGASGPAAMPAQLPPTSAYTYCVELSADEAMNAGAMMVEFSQPVINYVENFLHFPVGTIVPSGSYDRQKGAWMPAPNGRVIKVLGVTSGLADVDSDGDDVADNNLGIADSERQELAALYPVGQTLWRMLIPHFTPWDHNLAASIPDDAQTPGQAGAGPDDDDLLQNTCIAGGSIIECENQVLGESVPIVGTAYSLNYRSDRVPGRVPTRSFTLGGSSLPASLVSIGLRFSVAGRNFAQTFPPQPNQSLTFVWDGKDAYGRTLLGGQLISGSIDYEYPAFYTSPTSTALETFGLATGATLTENPARRTASISEPFTTTVGEGLTDARTVGLGGWTLSMHHFFDPVARVMHLGDGRRQRADSLSRVINLVVPAPAGSQLGGELGVGPDGSLYFVRIDHSVFTVRRLAPDGTETVVAGGGSAGQPDFGDGGPALQAHVQPTSIAVGPDESVYLLDIIGSVIRRVSPDGIIRRVAGRRDAGPTGDGNLATETQLTFSGFGANIAVGPDGSIYMINQINQGFIGRIRRVAPDGIIATVLGGGPCNFGDPRCDIDASGPLGLAPDGSLYFRGDSTIGRLTTDGVAERVAGNHTHVFSGDGGPALDASISNAGGFGFAPDGSVYFSDANNNRIRRIGPDGIITTVAGSGPADPIDVGQTGDTGPTLDARISQPQDIAFAPDGTLFLTSSFQGRANRIRRIGLALPGVSASNFTIASEDGAELYVFDSNGRHLRTLNALTGATLFEFGYDANGLLAQVIEKTGATDNVTGIQHDATGNPTAIIGPFGQITTLTVDGNGFLASVSNPAGEPVQMTSSLDGLMETYIDPRGKTTRFTYDALGRLTLDAAPAGADQTLARVTATSQFTVTRTTALRRATTYQTENLTGNVQRRTITPPDGTQNQSTESIDAGTTHVTSSDGTASDTVLGPDPRFGIEVPVVTSSTVSFPSALQFVTASARTAVLGNPADPLSLTRLTETNTVDGRTFTDAYTAETRTTVTTGPTGRTQTSTIDALGRLTQSQLANLNADNATYDDRGRLATVTSGTGAETRVIAFTYNASGFLETIVDPLERITRLDRDAAGRVTSKTLPDGRVVGFGFDAAGNPTSLTPPGRPAHAFSYSDRNELTTIVPPAVPGTGQTTFAYDSDKALTTVSRPDGQVVTIGYDSAGRRVSRTITAGAITKSVDTFSYDSAGRLSNILAASGVSLDYAFDGSLPIGETWSGPVSGTVTRTFDTSLRMASESVNGTDPIDFTYDDDSLLTGAGNLTIVRDPQHGLPTSSTLSAITTSTNYNSFGELSNYTAAAGPAPIYSYGLTRDALGRITAKVETIGGVTATFDYTYDAAGRLTAIAKNGTTVESYSFDDNGNRTNATVNGVTVDATYDDQDRLMQYGDADFTYTAAGELLSKTDGLQSTKYEYDAIGNLLGVTLPDARAITYVVDGRGRRVGKRVNGALVQGFLYRDALRPVAELDGTGAVVSRFVYAGRTVPAFMIKGGVSFRLIADQVGSVRLVVNASTGAIVQRMDYDSFGHVLSDTNPGFQPSGFGGGLYDSDTAFVRFGARDFDAETGRWTVKDPLGFGGGDANLYAFVRNEPVNQIDPTGLTGGMGTGGSGLQQIDALIAQLRELLQEQQRPPGPRDPLDPRNFDPNDVDLVRDLNQRRNIRDAYKDEITRLSRGRDQVNRLLARGCTQTARDLAKRLLRGGLHAFGEVLGLFDVIRVAAESIENGREPTLEDLASAYLGYPVAVATSSSPPII